MCVLKTIPTALGDDTPVSDIGEPWLCPSHKCIACGAIDKRISAAGRLQQGISRYLPSHMLVGSGAESMGAGVDVGVGVAVDGSGARAGAGSRPKSRAGSKAKTGKEAVFGAHVGSLAANRGTRGIDRLTGVAEITASSSSSSHSGQLMIQKELSLCSQCPFAVCNDCDREIGLGCVKLINPKPASTLHYPGTTGSASSPKPPAAETSVYEGQTSVRLAVIRAKAAALSHESNQEQEVCRSYHFKFFITFFLNFQFFY